MQAVLHDNPLPENTVDDNRLAPRIFIGQGRFSEARAYFSFFFFMNRDKLRARVAIQDLWGLKFYNVFNGTTIVGAVGEILKIMLSRLLQIAILKS